MATTENRQADLGEFGPLSDPYVLYRLRMERLGMTAEQAGAGLYGRSDHPAGDQYGPADMTQYDQHRTDDH